MDLFRFIFIGSLNLEIVSCTVLHSLIYKLKTKDISMYGKRTWFLFFGLENIRIRIALNL